MNNPVSPSHLLGYAEETLKGVTDDQHGEFYRRIVGRKLERIVEMAHELVRQEEERERQHG